MAEESIPVSVLSRSSLPPGAEAWFAACPGAAFRDGARVVVPVGGAFLSFPEGPEADRFRKTEPGRREANPSANCGESEPAEEQEDAEPRKG